MSLKPTQIDWLRANIASFPEAHDRALKSKRGQDWTWRKERSLLSGGTHEGQSITQNSENQGQIGSPS